MAQGAPEGADRMAALRFALVQLARLKAGEARLADRTLTITGEPTDRAAFVAINRALREGPGAATGITVSGSVAAPVIAPYLWEALKRDGRVVLRGYVPSDAERAKFAPPPRRWPRRIRSRTSRSSHRARQPVS